MTKCNVSICFFACFLFLACEPTVPIKIQLRNQWKILTESDTQQVQNKDTKLVRQTLAELPDSNLPDTVEMVKTEYEFSVPEIWKNNADTTLPFVSFFLPEIDGFKELMVNKKIIEQTAQRTLFFSKKDSMTFNIFPVNFNSLSDSIGQWTVVVRYHQVKKQDLALLDSSFIAPSQWNDFIRLEGNSSELQPGCFIVTVKQSLNDTLSGTLKVEIFGEKKTNKQKRQMILPPESHLFHVFETKMPDSLLKYVRFFLDIDDKKEQMSNEIWFQKTSDKLPAK